MGRQVVPALVAFLPSIREAVALAVPALLAPRGEAVYCELARGCPEVTELQLGAAYVVDGFLDAAESEALGVIFSAVPSGHPRVHLNQSLTELRLPDVAEVMVRRLVGRIQAFAEVRLLPRGLAQEEGAWRFQGKLFRDFHLVRRYFSMDPAARRLEPHTDSVHSGRCISAALHVGDETQLVGGALQTHRCRTDDCQATHARCRRKDTGDCRGMLEEGILEVMATVPYRHGRVVFFLSETLHSVTELEAGVRDLVFVWMSCSPTLRVLRNRHAADVDEALANGADVSERDDEGMTPLHWAAFEGLPDVAGKLQAVGALVRSESLEGLQPLHEAARGGHLELAELLLGWGAEVDSPSLKGRQPVHSAAQAGHVGLMKALLGRRAELEDWQHEFPLHYAAADGHAAVAEFLLDRRAAPDANDDGGERPLHKTARAGHFAVAEVLLARFAEASPAAQDGSSPLHHAAGGGHASVAIALLAARASVGAVDADGASALHMSAAHGHARVAEGLLAARADPSARTSDGIAPLHFAALEGHVSVVRSLVDWRADVRATALEDEVQPLHLAANAGHLEVSSSLMRLGAEPRALSKDGTSPADLAARAGYTTLGMSMRLDL